MKKKMNLAWFLVTLMLSLVSMNFKVRVLMYVCANFVIHGAKVNGRATGQTVLIYGQMSFAIWSIAKKKMMEFSI